MERRELLKLPLALGLLTQTRESWAASLFSHSPETIVSGFRDGIELHSAEPSGFTVTQDGASKRYVLANEIHSIAYSRKHDLKILIPKQDPEAAALYANGRLVKFYPAEGNYFYGHGVVDERRDLLYTTQAVITDNRLELSRQDTVGYIYVHSLPDLKPMGRFQTYGRDPHDLMILGDQLVVCNGGRDTCVTVIDLDTKKLVRSYPVHDPDISLRHVARLDRNHLVVIPLAHDRNRALPIYLLDLRRGLMANYPPGDLAMQLMRHQILSILVHGDFIYATCPTTASLIIWNRRGQFVKGHQIRGASNLCYSQKHRGVLVGSGEPNIPLHLVQVKQGQPIVTKLDWGKGIMGSHATIL